MKKKENIQFRRVSVVRILCCGIFYAGVVALYLFMRSYILLYLLLVFTLAVPLSLWSAHRLSKELKINIHTIEPWVLTKATGGFILKLLNPTWIPALQIKIGIEIGNPFFGSREQKQISMAIPIRGDSSLRLPLQSLQNGIVQIRIEQCMVQDLLGMVWYPVSQKVAEEYLVFPQRGEMEEQESSQYTRGITESEESNGKGNDFAALSDIREYIPGDRIKDIHWKLSAKRGELMVKERVSVSQSRISLLLNLSGDAQSRDLLVTQTEWFCRQMLEQQVGIQLLWWSKNTWDFEKGEIISLQDIYPAFGEMYHSWSDMNGTELRSMMRRCQPERTSYAIAEFDGSDVKIEIVENDA